MTGIHEIATWSERRPVEMQDEAYRAAIANDLASHLPAPPHALTISDGDLHAIKAAFIRRFNEDLPRTETLMAVAQIGYRLALRDVGPRT